MIAPAVIHKGFHQSSIFEIMQGNFLFSEFCFDDVDGLHSGSFQLVNVFYFPFSVFSGFKAVANYHGERTILDVAFCHHPLAIVVKPSLDFREVDMEFGYLIRVLHFPFYSFG